MHGLHGSAEVWSRSASSEISNPKADAAGTIYYSDAEKGRVHAVDSQGKDLWTAELGHPSDGSIDFGGERQMYVFQSHSFTDGSHLIYLSD
jgi:outer membrane protein assembly factor BamB